VPINGNTGPVVLGSDLMQYSETAVSSLFQYNHHTEQEGANSSAMISLLVSPLSPLETYGGKLTSSAAVSDSTIV
jgi:hypothetical protein